MQSIESFAGNPVSRSEFSFHETSGWSKNWSLVGILVDKTPTCGEEVVETTKVGKTDWRECRVEDPGVFQFKKSNVIVALNGSVSFVFDDLLDL